MPKTSAGILLHRLGPTGREVLLGHMGGPFWARKDAGAWSIPKGEHGPDEEPLAVAHREFAEELGSPVPASELVPLGRLRASGKVLTVWAAEGDLDAGACVSNTFDLEWPPRSGRIQQFPEIDRAAWFDLAEARTKLVGGQVPFLDRLVEVLGAPCAPPRARHAGDGPVTGRPTGSERSGNGRPAWEGPT
ncbi:NUDIX domain-containing protein [Blastococcus sp. CCUG 61487]|uniref:NUDIX domain-containing protein n=1 Tax=Blastococcus sp. CCUG 61487 TaxID=1840703 RepID=UPI0010C0EA48|nr:NUDIX domain-containing protein [Blastococcus sp. CCUG 61487]